MGLNRKMNRSDGQGGARLRVFHRKAKGTKSPRLLVKCGDCQHAVEIYYDSDGIEINGVNASLDEWRAILSPLLAGHDPYVNRQVQPRHSLAIRKSPKNLG